MISFFLRSTIGDIFDVEGVLRLSQYLFCKISGMDGLFCANFFSSKILQGEGVILFKKKSTNSF